MVMSVTEKVKLRKGWGVGGARAGICNYRMLPVL